MTERKIRDVKRREHIRKSIMENLEQTIDDPESLFAESGEESNEN